MSDVDAKLQELIDEHLDGRADEAALAALGEALRADPAVGRLLVERSLMEAHLYRLHGAEAARQAPAEAAARGAAAPRRFRRVGVLSAAAAVLLAVGAWTAWRLAAPPEAPTASRVVEGSVAVDGTVRQQVPDGARAEVVGPQSAVVTLGDGSRAELYPAAEAVFRVGGRDRPRVVQLAGGGGRFQVAEGRGEFRVETPVGTVVALGTDFRVQLLDAAPARREREDNREEARAGERRQKGKPHGEEPPRIDSETPERRGSRDREGERRTGEGSARKLAVFVYSGRVRAEFAGRSYELAAGQSLELVGKESRLREGPLISGRLTGVDRAGRTVSLLRGGDRPASGTYRLAQGAAIEIDARPADLADLREGMNVSLRLAVQADHVVAVRVVGQEVRGRIVSADPAAGTVSLQLGEDRGRIVTHAATDAAVVIDGRSAALADLREGMVAHVQLSADGERVMEIRVGAARKRGSEGGADRRERERE